MPRESRVVPSMMWGTKVLYLAEVSQYGAGGTIHPIKSIAGVWLPAGSQELPERQMLNSNNDKPKAITQAFSYVQ